ncbi:MAG: glycosyltransferase family 61 protein [Ignavibacteriales bacterium]
MIATESTRRIATDIRRRLGSIPRAAVRSGMPPEWLGYRWLHSETLPEYFARHGPGSGGALETVHPEAKAANPLPCNVGRREELPDDIGWWGFSCRDVPERTNGATLLATVPDCRIVFTDKFRGVFFPAILNKDGRAFRLREVAFRKPHAEALRSDAPPVRMKRATWVLERVYYNYAHWVTAHLAKLALLKARDALDGVVLPPAGNAFIDRSLEALGIDRRAFPVLDPTRAIEVDELTVIDTDRFRPELLRPVREALAAPRRPHRRIYISRQQSNGRRLINEDEIWVLLEKAGFERVFMERLSFDEQVALMAETKVLLAPHGAGLSNMIFCPGDADIVEIAVPDFPNPNFYALACAMDHRYWRITAESHGTGLAYEKGLRVDPMLLDQVLQAAGC